MRNGESLQQIALFDWWFYACKRFGLPQYSMYSVPNGSLRNLITAVKLKREGVKRGVPDVFMAVPRQGFHGLFIEMKYGKNNLTTEQKEFIAFAESEGYKCAVCYSWSAAKEVIEEYLK